MDWGLEKAVVLCILNVLRHCPPSQLSSVLFSFGGGEEGEGRGNYAS